jgi:hypothetical protein
VAKNSQHMLGKAMDFYLPDASAAQLRAIGMRLQNGGVGYYPNAYTPFVHLDVGSVRAWPRMTRDQLVRLFPDGKTVHVPSDGTPLPGYEMARAEVLAKGGTVAGYTAYADADAEEAAASQPRRKSFWATLFGGSDEDEDAEEIRMASRPGRALLASRGTPQNYYASDSNSSVYAALQPAPAQPVARQAPVVQPRPEPAPAPAVVAAIAPALREDLSPPGAAPLRSTRINGLPSTVQTATGPTLAWQQGAEGQNSNGSDLSIAKGMAFAPMPPRRPDANDAAEPMALAYAPLPPVRPGSLAATNPIPGIPELRGATEVALNLPSAPHPLPPPRPDFRPVAVAAAGPVDIPVTGSTSRDAPKDAKPQRVQPAAEAKPPAAAKQAPLTALSALMSAQPSLHMGFSSKPVGDLATNRFTGPAVKPLPVIR